MSALAQLSPGVIFAGDFRVIRPLKAGGMGAVYVVSQLSTTKQRALKVMLPELVEKPELRRRFETEAKVGARIKSDHVVEVIASGVDAPTGMPWLVMELLEGEDLESHVQHKGPLPPSEVLAIIEQLCHALGEAHREGIVHRDLKPENIFLAVPRRAGISFMVKVLDFGIARVAAEARTTQSATSTVLGTPLWMSPEQARPGVRVTPAADVWALGLIVYRLLTARFFWKTAYAEAPSVMMLMNEAFVLPMASASARAVEDGVGHLVPPGFDDWLGKCTARDPAARFPDATQAFDALRGVLAGASPPLAAASGAGGAMAQPAIATAMTQAADAPTGPAVAPQIVVTPVVTTSASHGEGSGPAITVTPVVTTSGAGAAKVIVSAPQVVVETSHLAPGMRPGDGASALVRAEPARTASAEVLAAPAQAPHRSRTAVVVSVLVTVTVAFGAVGLFFARSSLTGGDAALPVAETVSPTKTTPLAAAPATHGPNTGSGMAAMPAATSTVTATAAPTLLPLVTARPGIPTVKIPSTTTKSPPLPTVDPSKKPILKPCTCLPSDPFCDCR